MTKAAAHTIPTFDQNQNDALMKAIGAKGYDPMPPSQHLFYQDRDQPLSNRVVGVVYECTIRRGKDGKRSPVGREERSKFLTVAAIAKRLGVTVSNCWVAVRQAEADGRIRIDEDEHIWLGGNVREPRQSSGEDKAKYNPWEICTNYLDESKLLFLKNLPRDEADRVIAEQIEAEKLWKLRMADAMALLRSHRDADTDARFARYGYKEDAKPGGRPRVEKQRPFSVAIEFVQNLNGHSVHNSDSNSVHPENGFAQNGHPYVAESCTTNELQRVSADVPTESAPSAEASTPPTTPLTETPSVEAGEANEPPRRPLEDPDPIVNALQLYFHRKLDPQIAAEWQQFAAELEIPKQSVARWIGLVMEGKRAKGYKVYNPGALLQFARKDMRAWIEQSWREIKADRDWEEAERRRANADLVHGLHSMAAKKGMR